ncbi:MAG TPA: hypothetical protein VFM18_22590, partial [Methanosarcina sp.]|nr:hypothetical protein [Methanosarcina sp.]
ESEMNALIDYHNVQQEEGNSMGFETVGNYKRTQELKELMKDVRVYSEADQLFAIQIEKMLCEKLGRKWTSTGISIESLIDELALKNVVPIGYKLVPVKMTEEMFEALADSPWVVESQTSVVHNIVQTVRKEFRDQRYVEDGWNAILKSVPESFDFVKQKEKLAAMNFLESGEWQLTKNSYSGYLTEEANDETSWSVRRQTAPFSDSRGNRQWEGRTALDAIVKAKMALGI